MELHHKTWIKDCTGVSSSSHALQIQKNVVSALMAPFRLGECFGPGQKREK